MSHLRGFILFYFLVVGYFILTLVGVVSFELWPQVEFFHTHQEFHVSDVYSEPHGIRYLIVWPVYFFSELTLIDKNLLFSCLCAFLIYLVSMLLFYVLKANVHTINTNALAFIFFFTSCIAIFMNGRLVIGFFALSLLIFFVFRLNEKRHAGVWLMLLPLLLFCAGATSGVFIAVYSAVALCIVVRFFSDHYTSKKNLDSACYWVLIAFLLLYFPVFLMMFNKNVDYYGGGVESVKNAIDHGVLNGFSSAYLKNETVGNLFLKALWGCSIIFCSAKIYSLVSKSEYNCFLVSIVLVLFLFLFLSLYAYSIMAVSIVLLLFVFLYSNKLVDQNER